jgi:hypothetical protein
MPAMAITKNMPVVPDTPNRSSTTEETMMVSIVMPETGLRAVVAIALAATEAKKKENTSVSSRPMASTAGEGDRLPKKTAAPSADTTTPTRMDITGMSRSVRSSRASVPARKARVAMAKLEATTRRDFRIPMMPAAAMAPTPMKRT